MNGFEALELMKKGKWVQLVGKSELVFGLSHGFIGRIDDRGYFVETLFNFRLDYEEYKPKLIGWERVKEGEEYFRIDDGGVESDCEMDFPPGVMDRVYENANYFSTKEKAEEIDFKQTLFRKMQRFSDQNGGHEIDWKNTDQKKYYITYDYNEFSLFIGFNMTCRNVVRVYFATYEVTKQALELFEDDLIKYFTHDFGGSK